MLDALLIWTIPNHAPMRLTSPGILILLAAFLHAGCGQETTDLPGEAVYTTYENAFNQDPAARDSVLALFASVDTAPLREAFGRLPEYAFTRYYRTEQRNEEGFLVAYRERTVRHSGFPGSRRFELVEQDSSGTFDFGFFEQFVSANVESQDPRDLAPFLWPEDPPYLQPRYYEDYLYRIQPDTLLGDLAARVFEVRARPKEGDGKNIRRVQLYVDRGTNTLVGVRLERIDLAMFFREESRYFVHMQPVEGTWLPRNTRFESRIVMPFRPAQLFRTVATFGEMAHIEQELAP